MDILINQILAKAIDIHTVDLKTRRIDKAVDLNDVAQGLKSINKWRQSFNVEPLAESDVELVKTIEEAELEFTLTLTGRMPVRLFDEEEEEPDGQAEADVESGLKFLNGSTT
jgi:hypothetical protein